MQLRETLRRGLMIALAVGTSAIPTPGVTATQVVGYSVSGVSVYGDASSPLGAVVMIFPAIPNLEGCSNVAGDGLWIDFGQPGGQTLYDTVLAAFLQGRNMSFGVSGCGDNGKLPLIYRVDMCQSVPGRACTS